MENNILLMWKMKGINRKMCGTVSQMRDLPLNIALKEDFVMILLFNFRQKPWYSMNSRTLKRGLREYGLRRRNEIHSEHEV